MNLNEKDNHDSMIFSIGRNGASVYNNFQDDMPCDYDLKDEKCFDECYGMIESIKDDDKACIEKLLNHKAEKKAARKKQNNGYIIPQKPSGTGDYYEYNQNRRYIRIRAQIRNLCRNNFCENNSMHITLTFDAKRFPQKDFTNLKTAKAEFSKFIKRMNDHYDNFRHVTVYARQENRNWYFHMLCNLDVNTQQKFIEEIWGLGIVDTAHKGDKLAFKRIVKYMCDNMEDDFNELTGERAVLYSRGLQDNLKLKYWDKEDSFIIQKFIQCVGSENAGVNKTESGYYIKLSIEDYFDPIVMATPKKKKFKHQRYQTTKGKKKGGDAIGTK